MSVYVCGDTHFGYDDWKLNNRNWPLQKDLTKDDYLIITGDFGLLWDAEPTKQEIFNTKVLANRKFTTLFVDGNHENFTRLDALEEIDMFGGKVGKVCDSIYHLKRGYVYT
ncbi:MAG: metallophosphoesterase, partial [Candidatus Peribacteraceae bacterium]|nr:metallophosphoesterase [Candidatus Peribacteraceae bacterium]